MSEAKSLTFDDLKSAVSDDACALRCRCELQPAGGPGDKVFPPTYAGAVYAREQRRVPGRDEPVECVLLDSVQSQANRMEEALQVAVDEHRLKMPVISVDFSTADDGLLTPIGRITSLQAPHRVADAILRDSLLGDTPFRKTDEGQVLDKVSLSNATALYQLCPTALIFGMWDSTGPKGGLGAKFQRAMVSEIVGIDAVYGVKTSSRIDPLQIRAAVKVVKGDGEWTIAEDPQDKAAIAPSEVNHGNVTPDTARYTRKDISAQNRHTPDPLRADGSPIELGRIKAGGVTIASAEHSVTLSLPALRRLQFPVNGEDRKAQSEINAAGRTVLAALGLCSAALAGERGFDLRSRCLLWPTGPMEWELLDRPGETPERLMIGGAAAITLLGKAVAAAEKLGLTWRSEPLVLTPSPQLVDLVKKSQKLSAASGSDEGGE